MTETTEILVYAESEDHLGLCGVLLRPTTTPTSLIVWVHGNTGNFYSEPYILIGRALVERGCAFLSVNTRGQDVAVSMWHLQEDRPVAGGSAWERLEDAPFDIAAWVNYAASLGIARIILVGHSQGAAKVVYTQAQRQDARIAALVLASPDLHGHWPPELVAQARTLVDAGNGDTLLLPLMGAPWYCLSARNIVSRADVLNHVYASSEKTPEIAQIKCPILAFFGTGGDVGGIDELETLKQNAVQTPKIETRLIEGADHVYTGRETPVADLLAAL